MIRLVFDFYRGHKKVLIISALVLQAVILAGGGYLLGTRGWQPWHKTQGINFADLNQINNILRSKFDGTLDDSKLLDGAKTGLAAATGDPFTEYLTAAEAKALDDQLTGTLSGIGAEVGTRNGNLSIIAPIDGSPAAKAGLRSGDIIAKINGEDTGGLTVSEAVTKIRGPKGTTVKLTMVRGNSPPFDVTITRDQITVPSVKSSMPKPGIGVIKISQFGSDTVDLTNSAAEQLKQQGAKAIVLDLRDDPGGYLTAAVGVGSEFLDQGQLIVEERHGSKSIDKQNSLGGGELVGLPTVVLINGGSASASEIVAGALQDHHAATVVGETSYGKGSVQEIQKLGSGAELKVTVAHWYTPSGKNIGKEGIKPDVEVKMEQSDYDAGRDPQMDKALEILSK